MSIFGKCPSCGNSLPVRMKDRVDCSSCGKCVRADTRSLNVGSLLIIVVIYSTYSIDWKLSVILSLPIVVVTLMMTKYKVVEKDNE